MIDERFNVPRREGVDIEIVGGTGGVNGGAFLYTNLDTLAVGVVLKLPKLAAQQRRPEEIIAELKAHPAIAPLVEGGEVKEYSAHVIPEAGLAMMPKMTGDGMLVAGDAAALCLAAGIWLEGVNFAMASGIVRRRGGGRGARRRRRLARAGSPATSAGSPRRSCCATTASCAGRRSWCCRTASSTSTRSSSPNVVEAMFRVDNPRPKPGCDASSPRERKRAGVRRRDLARDGLTGWRTFG